MRSFVVLLLLGTIFASSARAASVVSEGASVFIYGVKVVTLKTSVGNLNPKARAAILAANIEKSASEGNIRIQKLGRTHQIFLDGQLVLTVSRPEAKVNQSTTLDLATTWARNIRKALLTPPIKLEVESLRMPMGATRAIPVGGSKFGSLTIEATDKSILKVEKTATGFSLRTLEYGRAYITLTAGPIVKRIPVAVLPYAANVPKNLVAVVSGIPASQDTVEGALENAVRNQLGADQKALIEYKLPEVSQVLPGESKTYTIHVKATGNELLPVEGPVIITVRNMALGRMAESELWYCNEPENLKKPGLIFTAPLRPETPARLLYHHINMMSSPLVVTVDAINDSDQVARLMVIPGDSKPDLNPVLAGVQAADQFMKGWVMSSGEVIAIPPKTRLPVAMRRIAHGQTMSGLCYLRLLDSGPDQVTIRTEARPAIPLDARWQEATRSSTPWRVLGAQKLQDIDHNAVIPSIHIYPNPYKEESGTYSVGGRHAFFRIGEKAIARADKLDQLSGNFGVTYTIKAQVDNPTLTSSEVEVVFEASAGYSGALFFVNGQYIKTPLLQPKTEAQILRFNLEPGGTKLLSIITVPLSGSSYPATLTIRPTSTGAYAKGGTVKR